MVGNPYLGIISGLPVQAQTSRAGSKMKTSSRGCTPLLETSVYSVGYREAKMEIAADGSWDFRLRIVPFSQSATLDRRVL
jgi:hypothetical protein